MMGGACSIKHFNTQQITYDKPKSIDYINLKKDVVVHFLHFFQYLVSIIQKKWWHIIFLEQEGLKINFFIGNGCIKTVSSFPEFLYYKINLYSTFHFTSCSVAL